MKLSIIYHIEFPGAYLRELLYKSVNTLSEYIKSRKKLPTELLFEAFEFDELFVEDTIDKFIDDDSLDEFEELKWQIR